MAYSYFEGPIFLFFSILILLVIVLNVVSVSLVVLSTIVILIYTLNGSILRRVVPFLGSSIDDRYVSRDVADIYYLDFLIRVVLNEMALLSVL